MKKKYYFIGVAFFIVLLIGYHFFAASQAEQMIDEAIQKETQKNDAISVQYSAIQVAPFAADVTINDLTIILDNHIERANKLSFDIGYIDFLNIYVGGISYGLDHLQNLQVAAIRPTYVNKKGLEEIKADTLKISYHGNALDGLRSAINGTPFASSQTIEAQSSGLTFSIPQTTFSTVRAHHFQYSGTIAEEQANFWTEGSHQFQLDSLVWTPSTNFQNSYSFFIKGFGYPTDAIPFKSAQLHSKPTHKADGLHIEGSVRSELALFSTTGFIQLRTPLEQSKIEGMKISASEFSNSFSNVLTNIERLLSFSIPKENGSISLQLEGPISNPSIKK
ncbi:hypothetical protein [Fodinibius halophilus]|uniref:DUF748 domain-containing protein n=1 Tax=Fodinibius halophilus TaxID=1736908 RepID=A0A6M1T141_9BACT|nr:hypothetical protein [Fodinibius halophilus]NGP89798.1 hypothetical protein [Fodinibius halophilus]